MRFKLLCLITAACLPVLPTAAKQDGFDPYKLYEHVKLKPPVPSDMRTSAPAVEPKVVTKTSSAITKSWPISFPPKPKFKPVLSATKPAANPMLDIETEIAAETAKTNIDEVTLMLMNKGEIIEPNSSTAFAPLIAADPAGVVFPMEALTDQASQQQRSVIVTTRTAVTRDKARNKARNKAKDIAEVTRRQKQILY